MRAEFNREDMPTKTVFYRYIGAICQCHRLIVVPQYSGARGIANLAAIALARTDKCGRIDPINSPTHPI